MKRSILAFAIAATVVAADLPRLGAGGPSPAELDTLLAPVALYPDQLLAQMLLCAANAGKVAALNEWMKSQSLKGSDLQTAAAAAGFEDSYVALALFPDVVEYMAVKSDWTAKLGQAFAADKTAVFASIQRLRAKAQKAGTLKSTPQQQVSTKTTSSGEQVIVIEPANPQIVYVPQYNPQVVYTQPTTQTVVVDKSSSSSSSADAALAGVIGFTAGIAIGAAIDNNYYYGPYGWHGGAYMYNDAWDDYYDAREDAREDWQDHREDMYEDRSDRAKNAQEERTERQKNTQEQRTERQQSGTTQQRQQNVQQARNERQQSGTTPSASAQSRGATATTGTQSRSTTPQEARGYSRDASSSTRKGTGSDAFSGYSSGKSERAASQRGQKSRSSSRSGGGSRRR